MLIDCVFGGIVLRGLRDPLAWSCLAVLVWSRSIARPALGACRPWTPWLLWSLASLLVSAEPARGLPAFLRSATAVLLLGLACASWSREERERWSLLLCATALLLAAAAWALPIESYPMTGLLYPYYNYTAAVEAAAAAACLGFLFFEKERTGFKTAALLVLSVSLGCILAAKSRGALLAAAAAAVWVLARCRRWRVLAGLLCAGLAVFGLLPVGTLAPALKLDRQGSWLRPQIWRSALAAAGESPWLGSGPGQADRALLRHNFPAPTERAARYGMRTAHAHSEVLQTALETGWPGLALFLLGLGSAWLAALRGTRGDWSREAGLAASVALFTQGLFDNVLALPAMQLLFFSSLSVAQGDDRAAETVRPGLRPLLALGLALSSLAWLPDWAVRRWRERAFEAGGDESMTWMSKALALAPKDSELWADMARLRIRGRDTPRALDALARAESYDPTNPIFPVMAAELMRLDGRWPAVESLARRGLELEPSFLHARLLNVEALLRLGKTREAAAEFEWLSRAPAPGGPGYDGTISSLDPGRLEAVRAMLRSRR